MKNESLAKKIYKAQDGRIRGRGGPRKRWKDGLEEALGCQGLRI